MISWIARRLSAGMQTGLSLLFFSVAYFTSTLVRASEKRFWYDELCTLYICRLPTFRASWTAVLHGSDYNPPLFYLLHRLNAAFFGEGHIATRIPEILAFWVLSVCLLVVARREAGLAGGFTAMAFPFLSGAYFYAYEARPPGLVLGFCGLMILCWSSLSRQPRSRSWLLGFAVSLQAAVLTHCYAIVLVVPFAIVELLRAFQTRQIRWRVWAAFAIPPCLAMFFLVPLLQSYRRNLQTGGFTVAFPPSFAQFPDFYRSLFDPAILLVLLLVVLFAFDWRAGRLDNSPPPQAIPLSQKGLLLLAISLLGMPFYGILFGKIVHGAFFHRYFLAATAGVALLLGMGAHWSRRPRVSLAVALLVIALTAIASAKVVWHRLHDRTESLIEPSVKYILNTHPHDDLATYSLLGQAPPALPIAIPNILDSLYLVHYWTAGRGRVVQLVPSKSSIEFLTIGPVFEWCRPESGQIMTYQDFFQLHTDFLVYSETPYSFLLSRLISQGATVRSLRFDDRGAFLAQIYLPKQRR